jgi:modulator of drug activity B
MSHILIINAGKKFANSEGNLNRYLSEYAGDYLQNLGHQVKHTHVDAGYQLQEEVAKISWADSIIYQMPAWWMEAPWILKKYVDEVFSAGHGTLFTSDGRTRSDESQKYGSGGLLQGKSYMISITWNAPQEAFSDPAQFFEGKGIDAVLFPFHKANQFIGLSPLPTFMCNDVIKQPDIAGDVERLKAHLQAVYA